VDESFLAHLDVEDGTEDQHRNAERDQRRAEPPLPEIMF
jgi:hypothetical protein